MAESPASTPFYRSRWFWCWVLGLLLLIGGWCHSFAGGRGRTWSWTQPSGKTFYVSHGAGLLTLGVTHWSTSTRLRVRTRPGFRQSFWVLPNQPFGRWYLPLGVEFQPFSLHVRHWWFVAVYLAVWLPWWWARHGRRREWPPRFPGSVRPWFRSPFLWAGIPGAVLLTVAWVDSTGHRSYVGWGWTTPGGRFIGAGAESAAGQVAGWVGRPYRESTGIQSFRQRWATGKPPATAVPAREKGKQRFRFSYLSVTAAYGVVWFGLFAGAEIWSRRRARRELNVVKVRLDEGLPAGGVDC